MINYFTIVDFNSSYLNIYEKCFTDEEWLKCYGFNCKSFELGKYISQSVLTSYHNVERLILLNRSLEPILFAHLCVSYNICIIVGGLIPELLNKGQGVMCSLIVFDYAFKTKRIGKITVRILKDNQRSLRMVKKIGFCEEVNGKKGDKSIDYTLYKNNFPNIFCSQLLKKVKYEKA